MVSYFYTISYPRYQMSMVRYLMENRFLKNTYQGGNKNNIIDNPE